MKTKAVPSKWMMREGLRLDVGPYLSGALEGRVRLDELAAKKDRLADLTQGGSEGIYHAGREGRRWVSDPEYGVPFLGSTDILKADLSYLPLISKKQVTKNPKFTIRSSWTLITRSGTIGRMAYARPDMDGMACSEHVMRVVPNPDKVPAGYLYAYLSSKFGMPLVVSGTYGAIIQHIEPHHIADLPVPRLGDALEHEVHELMEESARLLTAYQRGIEEGTKLLFESVGLTDITRADWHNQGPDVGFVEQFPTIDSLRAVNFSPRFKRICSRIKAGPYKTLDEICVPGTIKRGGRFKRVEAAPDFALRLLGQKQLFWLKPVGRWIAKSAVGDDVTVKDGTILVAARGTLGENELYCRSEFITGYALEHAYSEDILRLVADVGVMPRGCLFAFIRSGMGFRMLRSISVGTKIQDHHYQLLPQLPIPFPPRETQQQIGVAIVEAYENRHGGVAAERKAVSLLESAIEEAT